MELLTKYKKWNLLVILIVCFSPIIIGFIGFFVLSIPISIELFPLIISVPALVGFVISITSNWRDFVKAKPEFKISMPSLEQGNNVDDSRSVAHLEIRNKGNVEATGVKFKWILIDKMNGKIIGDNPEDQTFLGTITPHNYRETILVFYPQTERSSLKEGYEIRITVFCDQNTEKTESFHYQRI